MENSSSPPQKTPNKIKQHKPAPFFWAKKKDHKGEEHSWDIKRELYLENKF